MYENADKKWREFIGFYLSSMTSYVLPIQGYAMVLEIYLEALSKTNNSSLLVESALGSEITPEMALNMIRVLRENAQHLNQLRLEAYEEFHKGLEDHEL